MKVWRGFREFSRFLRGELEAYPPLIFRRVLISYPMWQLARPNPDMLYEGRPPPPPPPSRVGERCPVPTLI